MLIPSGAYGPILKASWDEIYMRRYEQMAGTLTSITWDWSFIIKWRQCGHFSLSPKIPKGLEDVSTHVDEKIVFRGVMVGFFHPQPPLTRGPYINRCLKCVWDKFSATRTLPHFPSVPLHPPQNCIKRVGLHFL